MGKWMDLAAEIEAASAIWDKRDNRDNSRPNVPNVPNVPPKLPPDIRAGLITLKSMAAPRLVLPEGWPAAVSDALGLARDGWVTAAFALGWSPLDLFGAMTDRNGQADADGLAVWLGGRPVLAIAATYASVGDGIGRAYFNRSTCFAETLLWDVGREAAR